MLKKSSTNLLFKLQLKRFKRLWASPKILTKFTFLQILSNNQDIDYFDYPLINCRLLRMLIVPGNFFGLGLHGYYSLEFSKKQRLLKRNDYNQKLQAKKDSWFFYGFSIARRLNFLSSTITLWNVFYNEIMEKTFPIFSLWNTLVGPLNSANVRHFMASIIHKNSLWKWFFFIWKYPWAFGRITLAS